MEFDVSLLLLDGSFLTPSDAAAAVITVNGQFLLQKRDLKKGIFFPGHYGLFGGGIEKGESPAACLLRELHEELGLVFSDKQIKFYSTLTLDFGFAGGPRRVVRTLYELHLEKDVLNMVKLGEGEKYELLGVEELLDPSVPFAPYDYLILWMYINRNYFKFKQNDLVSS